ncbi:muramidase-released protein, partial [Streptococcus mitis subsp. carlssonii]
MTKYELSDGTELTGELTFDNATTPTTVEEKGLAVANATDVSNGTNYDASTPANKPNKITTATGEVYYLVSSDNGVKAGSATVTGTVEEGKIKEVTYVYEKAGSVVIKYINTEGTEIKATVQDSTNAKPGTAYNAAETDEKPATIEFNNKKYKLVTKEGTTTTNATYSAEAVVTNGENVGAAEGQVVSGKTLEVTYVYEEVKGNVLVKYVDETGAPLAGTASIPGNTTEAVTADGVKAVTEAELGTSYDNKVAEKKATKITTADGKVYELVTENNGLYNTSEPETGTVTEADKVVTFVYKEKKSAVNVKYVDKSGQPIAGTATMPGDSTEEVTADGLKPVTNASVNTDYNVEDKKASKITTADGKVYRLIAERDGLLDGSKPVSGKVEENEITVTYQYELVNGNVTVSYKDTEGNKIPGYETPKDAEKDAPTGKAFNTATEALKPAKITTPDGKVYNLVPGRTEGNENGKVTENPQNVTYVYELAKGNVTVSYKDTEGNKIPGYETPKDAEKDAPTGKAFNTATTELKPSKITTPDGKVYNLVPTRTEGNENGKVTETPQNVTYVYELAKGNVTVTYKDTEGNKIPGYETPKTVETQSPTGKEYTTVTEALKPSKITTSDGKVYNLVPGRTEGNENGKVTENPQNVTYVYELAKGDVTVSYKDIEGSKIPGYETPKDAEKDAPTGKDFNTATNELKPSKITTPDGKVYNLVPGRTEGNESGKVTENPQNVTYVYELAKGDVTVSYKDTEGNKIPGYETPKDAEKDAPTGKAFNTATAKLKPAKITTPDGKVYNLVPTRTEGNENGKVTENPQNVTYVYELAKGDVTVNYTDTEGNAIEGKTSVKAETQSPTGKEYNTNTPELKPETITTESGKVYKLVPAQTVGKENGKVTVAPTEVTYKYELQKGDVTVSYTDTEGNAIEGKTSVKAETQSPTGKEYNTNTPDLKPETITTESGKVYKLVPAQTVGKETGKVTVAPTEVTYKYELQKGDVTVSYTDTEGNAIEGKTSVKAETQSPTGKEYNTNTPDLKPETITTANGDVYEFVKKSETSASETGKVNTGVTTVEYVYRKVVTSYVDEEGKEINPSDKGTKDKKDIPEYIYKETKKDDKGNTTHVYRQVITSYVNEEGKEISPSDKGTKDKKDIPEYIYKETKKDEKGNTTHVYRQVVTSYVNEEGKEINPSDKGTKDKKDIPEYIYKETKKDEKGNTTHVYRQVVTSYVNEEGKEI